MASSTLPPSSSSGTGASMWAGQSSPASPAPNRGGWGSQGSAFRGLAKGRGGARGTPRGAGRSGRGASNARGGGPARSEAEVASAKPTDQSKERGVKAPPIPSVKSAATSTHKSVPPFGATSAVVPPNLPGKGHVKPKAISRKASEQKTPRTKAPPISEPSVVPVTHSPSLSTSSTTASRGDGRRKRSNAKTSGPPSRKASVSVDRPVKLDRPGPIVTKDVPPHFAAAPDTPTFDIKLSVDALVERVRAVAMDRPNTPGSHIDWAGDDDDSLPDLDDWGVTSSTAGTVDHPGSADTSRIISPILEDTLKPLPSLDDFGPQESAIVREHAVHASAYKMASIGESPTSRPAAEVGSSKLSDPSEVTNDSSTSTPPSRPAFKAPLHPSLPPRPVGATEVVSNFNARRSQAQNVKGGEVYPSSHVPPRILLDERNTSSNDSSPERSSASSMHAVPTSHSAPSDVPVPTIPVAAHRKHFNPTHNRAYTVGARVPGQRQPDHVSSDSERPGRGDQMHHARTQSTPPTGPGTHARVPHATRPVITVDAISKLARTLGQTPLRRESTAQE